MIKYYPLVRLTYSEIKNKGVLLIHSLNGCMFNCYKCINYSELIEKKHDKYLLIDDIIEKISLQDSLFDYLVLSGGEFFINSIEDLIHDLSLIRRNTDKKIIIYTTGYYLEKMKKVDALNLVDGYHIDMKLPYHLLDIEDEELIKYTLGRNLKKEEINNLKEAIEYVIKNDKGFNQIRSVKYPYLDKSAFDQSSLYVEEMNKIYNKNTPYEVHSFIEIESKT